MHDDFATNEGYMQTSLYCARHRAHASRHTSNNRYLLFQSLQVQQLQMTCDV
jgi:hypothetical protein